MAPNLGTAARQTHLNKHELEQPVYLAIWVERPLHFTSLLGFLAIRCLSISAYSDSSMVGNILGPHPWGLSYFVGPPKTVYATEVSQEARAKDRLCSELAAKYVRRLAILLSVLIELLREMRQ